MITDALQEMGLNKRESQCYVALLELGSSKTGAIVKKTKIPSSKIYEILDRLISRGLVSYVKVGKIKHYQASDPNVLINYMDERMKLIEEVVPQLLLKQKLSKKQSVELFEGQKALFSLYADLIKDSKEKEQYLVFSVDEENKNDAANLFFKNLAVRRKEKKLDVKLLKNMKHYKKEKHTKLQLRFTEFNLPQGITIFRDVVVMLSWTESPIAIKIESKTIADQFRKFFLEQWTIAKI